MKTERTCRLARRVDFLGPPGVGKSMLCKAILVHNDNISRDYTADSKWVSMQQALRLAEQNAFQHNISTMSLEKRVKSFLRLFRHGVQHNLLQGRGRPFESQDIEFVKDEILLKFLEQHHALFCAVTEQWFDPEMDLPPLPVRYNELLLWTRRWLFSRQWAKANIIADNSRFTRAVSELLSNEKYGTFSKNLDVAKDYCLSPMCPNGIVHIAGDPKVVLERIVRRQSEATGQLKQRHPGHRGLSEKELIAYTERRNERNAVAIRFFREQGISVITLFASTPLDENVRHVQRFLVGILMRTGFREVDQRESQSLPSQVEYKNIAK